MRKTLTDRIRPLEAAADIHGKEIETLQKQVAKLFGQVGNLMKDKQRDLQDQEFTNQYTQRAQPKPKNEPKSFPTVPFEPCIMLKCSDPRCNKYFLYKISQMITERAPHIILLRTGCKACGGTVTITL